MTAAVASKGECEIVLGGVKRVLSLKIGDLEELEARLGIGLEEIINRLRVDDDGSGVLRMPDWRITDARAIIQIALEHAGWKGTRDDVLRMMLTEGMTTHAVSAHSLLVSALQDLPGGNASAPGGEVRTVEK